MSRKRTTDECGCGNPVKKTKAVVNEMNVQAKGRFQTNDVRRFDFQFPHFREPAEIGCFSLDISRNFHCDKSQQRHFIPPSNCGQVHFDLKKGYSGMMKKDETQLDYINTILRWIDLNRHKFLTSDGQGDRKLNTDFICWRGLMTMLLCTPYENNDGWKIAITLHNGTYYLCEFKTEAKKRREREQTDREREMCCWGWKFEQYITSDHPHGTPDPEAPYNNIEAYCTVVRSRLNSHSLVFAGEVDALDSVSVSGKPQYVEFKTSREFSHPRQQVNFKRFKLIKWWAQSFLVGIPKIVCGFRDDDGIVHRLETYSTNRIPSIARDIQRPWQANVCFNFLDELLTFIKATIKEDDYRVVHLLEWYPGNDVQCTRLGTNSEYNFLPDWFTKSSA